MARVVFVRQENTLLAGIRFVLHRRAELTPALGRLNACVPGAIITGPPVLVLHYISSESSGTLVELGLPVSEPFRADDIHTFTLPRAECLAVTHSGPLSGLGDAYGELYGWADERGIVSDEYGVEVLHDMNDFDNCTVEARLVIHKWEKLLRKSLSRVLGDPAAEHVFGGCSELAEGTELGTRFELVKGAMERLDRVGDEFEKYDCVSSCAHVFPQEQVDKLRAVFLKAGDEGLPLLEAVDRVIAFMKSDPGWGEAASRDGSTIFTAKGPRDRKAYEAAGTPREKAAAACFCPIIRKKLDEGMPACFCYCGAGWYRQQWEGATGLPVRVEVLASLLKGDPECRFAVHLPEAP